jgi:hypothetical protein
MRITKEALAIRVVVRRAWIGAAPFRWEVYREEMEAPIYVSSDRFRSMHEAYQAGQARLVDFIPQRPLLPRLPSLSCSQHGKDSPTGVVQTSVIA